MILPLLIDGLKELKNMNQNKNVDWMDVIIGLFYTFAFIGALLVIRLAFGIDVTKLIPSDVAIVEATVLGGLVVLMGSLYLKMIYHWMEKLIKWGGDRSFEKRSVHGLPVNTNSMGFKYAFNTAEIADTSRMIEDEGLHEQFEDTVWFINMENRQKAYKYKLLKKQKKFTKQVKRYKKKKNTTKLDIAMTKLSDVKDNLKLTNQMNVSIKKWEGEKVKVIDDELVNVVDINVRDLEPNELMDIDNKNPNGFIEKWRHNKFVLYMDKNVLPLLFPVAFIAMTIYYAVVWKDTWTEYERYAFITLMSIFGYMLPLRVFSFFKKYFPIQELNPVLNAGYVFSKFRARYHDQSQEFKQQLREEDAALQQRIKDLISLPEEDKEKDKA